MVVCSQPTVCSLWSSGGGCMGCGKNGKQLKYSNHVDISVRAQIDEENSTSSPSCCNLCLICNALLGPPTLERAADSQRQQRRVLSSKNKDQAGCKITDFRQTNPQINLTANVQLQCSLHVLLTHFGTNVTHRQVQFHFQPQHARPRCCGKHRDKQCFILSAEF